MKKIYSTLILFISLIITTQGQLSLIIAASNSNNIVIDYKKHGGVAYLKAGKILNGWFKYDYWEFPTYNFKYLSNDSSKQEKVFVSNITKLTLAGSDTTLCFRKDSTEFYYLPEYKGLYRKMTSGKIEVYDRLINSGEKNEIVSTEIVVKYEGSFKKLGSIKELNNYIKSIIKSYVTEKQNQDNINIVQLFSAINHFNS